MKMLGGFWRKMGKKYKKKREHLQSGGVYRREWKVAEQKSTGEQIRIARLAAGLSAEKLAGEIGVDKNTVYKWENGHQFPDSLALKGLYVFLGMSIDTLFGGERAEAKHLLAVEVRGHLSTGQFERPKDVALLGENSPEKREVYEFSRRLVKREVLTTVFGVRVSGSGLAPEFRQSDLLLFEQVGAWRAVENKDLVLASFAQQGGSVALKRYRKGLKLLEGLREALSTERIGNGIDPVGVLVGLWRDFSK